VDVSCLETTRRASHTSVYTLLCVVSLITRMGHVGERIAENITMLMSCSVGRLN
jgi:hypothetical protein